MTRRRFGAEDSQTRRALLDAAAQIMLEEGYAAATSRRVAARAGVKPALVHYYFRTMDDLYLALFRRGAEANLRRQEKALAADRPLQHLWEFGNDPDSTALMAEFIALANHRKTIKAELLAYAERFRTIQIKAVTELLNRYGVDTTAFHPAAATVILTSISRILAIEVGLGLTAGHAETIELVERFLHGIEPPRTGDADAPTDDHPTAEDRPTARGPAERE